MFRMSKEAFLLLHSKVQHRITPKHPTKGVNSSGSCVDSLLLFAATLRWLAGGSPWDICFGFILCLCLSSSFVYLFSLRFHIAYSTLHQHKYSVIAAINDALSGNAQPACPHNLLMHAQATSFSL